MMTPAQRFLDHTYVTPAGCHYWHGSIRSDGYGRFRVNGKTVLAHRAAYLFAHGYLPDAPLKICHTCDIRSCVNPGHLFVGTQADNVADMVKKGRKVVGNRHGERNSHARLTEEQVSIILSGNFKGRGLAKRFGVAESTISMVKTGRNWNSLNANRRAEMKL